jgi:1-acyl-sn-glycerol-3-phosphate acyltransferase
VAFARVVVAVGRPLAWLVFRPRVRGRDHLPREGGVVVAPIHLSGFDAVAIAYALAPRVPRMMGKNQLFHRPRLGPFVRALGAFPARDEESIPGGVTAAAWLAAGGEVVVIFPEGARRRGRDHRLRTGAARTALTAEVPLVPAALTGTDGWRRLRRWQVVFGLPVAVADLPPDDVNAAAREATRRLGESLEALEREL